MPKIIKIEPANNGKHKWTAYFDNGKKTKFGQFGAEDFTIHKDLKRRELYRKRHLKDLETNDPMRAGFLSYFILWGRSTSIEDNIDKFNKMFG